MQTTLLRRALPWSLLALSAAVVVWLSAAGCEKVSVMLAALALCLVGVGPAVCWARRRAKRRAATVGLWCVLLLSVGLAHWPLRAAFLLARPGLEEAAGRVAEGAAVDCPFRAGPFRVLQTQNARPGTVCLWLDLDGGGRTGLVRHTGPAHEVAFNVWSSVRLGERWQLLSED